MTTVNGTYSVIEAGKTGNRLGCSNIISSRMLLPLVIWHLTVPGFTHLMVLQKK